ncbi:MAG TPA: hypothetical protein VI754_02330 [Bacteriovoracaceae bacterium]|nr:hypothetical protein [Bacteriovoracaceae bacterium]
MDDFYAELKINSPTSRLKNGMQNVVLLKTLSQKMKDILDILDANTIVEKEVLTSASLLN